MRRLRQSFMEEMTRKQPDVDRVTKTYKRKATEPAHGPFIDKSRSHRTLVAELPGGTGLGRRRAVGGWASERGRPTLEHSALPIPPTARGVFFSPPAGLFPGKSLSQAAPPPMPILSQSEAKNPRINQLSARWQQVWLLALERQRKLNDALDRLEEVALRTLDSP